MFDLRIVSRSLTFYLGCCFFCFGVAVADERPGDGRQLSADSGSKESGSSAADSWTAEGWPLIQQFCLDCHNADFQEGELDLSTYEQLGPQDVAGGGGAMQRVLEMVRFGAMPPEDADQPTPTQRKRLVSSLDRTLFAVSCDLRPRPGKVTARRLNRAEYNHSIRDLFGLDLRPADAFPSDEVGAGFDNNGDVLSLSPMLMEKYLTAAEEVASQVLVDPDTLPSIDDDRPSDQLMVHGDAKTGSFNGRFLAPDAFLWADFEVPVSGQYRVRVRGGNSLDDQSPTRLAIYDGDGVLRETDTMGYYGGSGGSKSIDFKLDLEAGKHRFYVEPLEQDRDLTVAETKSEFFAKLDPDLIAAAEQRQKKGIRKDSRFDRSKYPFMIRRVEVSGPTQPPKELLPPSQNQILRRYAKRRDDKWYDVDDAARECLRPLLRRAFRGVVSDQDVTPYVNLVSQATERGESYYRGLQIAISAVLVSPRFLFRVETPPDDWPREEDGSVRLTPHQLATRLSYFLWSSLPDESLLREAESGDISDEATVERLVRRMIDDPKSEAIAEQFAAQWLGLRNLKVHEADTERFGTFTPSLRDAMARETMLVFADALRSNRPVADLLTTDYTFVNGELAAHYGIEGIQGDEFQRVSLKGTPRRGVLSHASVLTLTSNPTRTSPVKRGKWILENVLGTPPPDPPAGVPELEETKTAGAKASLREQLELHRASPTCASCHRVMDQLGFGLEQYDAVGRFREQVDGVAVNAAGELPGGRAFDGASQLSEILSRTESEAFARTVAERLMTFALGRELTPTDRCTVDEIITKTSKNDHRMVDLILEVANSRPFQYYDWVDPAEVIEDNDEIEENNEG